MFTRCPIYPFVLLYFKVFHVHICYYLNLYQEKLKKSPPLLSLSVRLILEIMKNCLGKPWKIPGIYLQYFASHTFFLFMLTFDNVIKERAMIMNVWVLLITKKSYLNI